MINQIPAPNRPPVSTTPASAHARLAVRDWLETQSRIIGYWRDVLVSAGECDDLVEILDDHAQVLLMAALQGDGENPARQ